MTGVVFSNIMLAALPEALRQQGHLHQPERGAVVDRRQGLQPATSSPSSWPNDAYHEAAGQYANTRDLKSVYLLAPNYQAGKDSLAGFKRNFKGQVVGENYTKLGQLDYAAELAADPRRQAAGALHLPARRHGHQLHQAVRRRRPVGKDIHAAAARLLAPTRTSSAPVGDADGSASSTPRTGRPTSTTRPTRSSSPSSRRNTSACRRCTPRRATTRRC